jgi:RNA recognition motif-containing protein
MVDKPPQHNDNKLSEHDNNNKRKIFVGGLSWSTTEDGLRAYFEKYGPVQDVVIMRDKFTGRSRGFGFVTFADDGAIAQVTADTHTLDGRAIEAKKAIPRGEMTNRTKKIFVGGLPLTTTEEEFRKYFEKFGKVSESQIIKDRATGRSRGFGFITFESELTVEHVLSLSHQLSGKKVEVKKAEPRKRVPLPRYSWPGFASSQLPFANFAYVPPYFGYLPANYRGQVSEMTFPYLSLSPNSPVEGSLTPQSPSQQSSSQSPSASPHLYTASYAATTPMQQSPAPLSPSTPLSPYTLPQFYSASASPTSLPITQLISPPLTPNTTNTAVIISSSDVTSTATSATASNGTLLPLSTPSSAVTMSTHLSASKSNNNGININNSSSTTTRSINNVASTVNMHSQLNSKYNHNR